jgi:undecaprenyl-diphosphatase
MLWFLILLLAVIQGITEFLPVSSSGHLVVIQELFRQLGHPIPEKETLLLDVALHFGTVFSILIFFRRRIWDMLARDWRLIGLIVVASVPAGVAGVTLKKHFEAMFENPLGVGCFFFITGGLLLWGDWYSKRRQGETTCSELSCGRALWIGLFQAFAILPGVSRSGSTITAGLTAGMRRDEAATFSMLLAIPAIAGAGLLEGLKRFHSAPDPIFMLMLAVGVVVSFVVGLAAIWVLLRVLNQGHLKWFAWWVIGLGTVVVLWQLTCPCQQSGL